MVFYNVVISPKALSQLDSYIAYLQDTLLNKQAADSVWQDAMDTRKVLETVAESLVYCTDLRLRRLGYRMIKFRRHRYVMLYLIDLQRTSGRAGREEGRAKGRAEGGWEKILSLISIKCKKGKSVATIAEELEEDPAVIERAILQMQL